jgi:hypothetical protein
MNVMNRPLPACVTRDRLTSPYWPNLSAAGLHTLVALGMIFLLTSLHRLNGTDLWGHLNFGRWIVEHGQLPAVDPFAAQPTDVPVLHTAWLSQVLGYVLFQHAGHEGLVLAHACLVTLTAAVLISAAARRGVPDRWAWMAGIAMWLLDLPVVGTIRPQLFGQLGAALCLLAISPGSPSRWSLGWLALLGAAWANLHGSVLMGLAILGGHAVAATWDAWQAQRRLKATLRACGPAWAATLAFFAGTCLNPHGPLLLWHTARFGQHAALASISEWRPLTPRSLTGVLVLISAGLALWAAKKSPRKWETQEVLLLVVFGLATLPAIRMLAWWALVWPWAVLPHLVAMGLARRDHKAPASTEPRPGSPPLPALRWPLAEVEMPDDEPTAMRALLALGFVFFTVVVSPPTYSLLAGQPRGEGQVLVRMTPIYLADEIVRRGLSGTLAAPLDWADFLVFKSAERLQPMVDSHVHLTDEATWRDYETIFRGLPEWPAILQQRGIRYLALSRQRFPQLARAVLQADREGRLGVQVIYQDQEAILAELVPTAASPTQPGGSSEAAEAPRPAPPAGSVEVSPPGDHTAPPADLPASQPAPTAP